MRSIFCEWRHPGRKAGGNPLTMNLVQQLGSRPVAGEMVGAWVIGRPCDPPASCKTGGTSSGRRSESSLASRREIGTSAGLWACCTSVSFRTVCATLTLPTVQGLVIAVIQDMTRLSMCLSACPWQRHTPLGCARPGHRDWRAGGATSRDEIPDWAHGHSRGPIAGLTAQVGRAPRRRSTEIFHNPNGSEHQAGA